MHHAKAKRCKHKFAGEAPINNLNATHQDAKENIMKKEDMIKRILRGLEYDFFMISTLELDKALEKEKRLLNEKTYSEVETLYYATV